MEDGCCSRETAVVEAGPKLCRSWSGVRFGYFAHRPKVRFLPGTLKPCLRSPWSSAHKDMDKNEEVSGREKNAKMC